MRSVDKSSSLRELAKSLSPGVLDLLPKLKSLSLRRFIFHLGKYTKPAILKKKLVGMARDMILSRRFVVETSRVAETRIHSFKVTVKTHPGPQ